MTTKTVTIDEADRQLNKASEHLTNLKAKILDKGPGAVSAEELGDAAHAVEHARLTVQHAAEAAEAEAKRQRLARLQELKAEILDQAGDVDAALDAMRQIEQAAALLISTCSGRQKLIGKWTQALRAAGVPRYEAGGKIRTHVDGRTYGPATQLTDEHAGMGWTEATMGRGDTVHVDDRKLTQLSPGILIAAALERAARAAGYGIGHLAPIVEVQGHAQGAVDDPETWLRARY